LLNIANSNDPVFRFDNIPDSTLNTGYWQNSSEEYPDTDDSDIWEVSNGVGQSTGDTLRDQKVRHHRMPDHRNEPIVSKVDANNDTAYILKVKLKNVQIPDEIKEKVKAYKVYYAKPTNSNKRVIDQSFTWRLFYGTDNSITGNTDNHYVSILPKIDSTVYEVSPETVDDNGLACMPFYSLKNKDSIAGLNYLLKIYVPTTAENMPATSAT